MTEDEEWDAIEQQDRWAKLLKARIRAVDAAGRLCEEHKDAIAYFTIRQAFEIGYMEAIKNERI